MNIYRKSLIEVLKRPFPFLVIGLSIRVITSVAFHNYWNYLFQPLMAFTGAFFGRLSDNKKMMK